MNNDLTMNEAETKKASEMAKVLLDNVSDFIKYMERFNATNEQWFLDFEDKLNELSIKNHDTKKEEAE